MRFEHVESFKYLGSIVSKKLMIFERKVLRKIFGPTKQQNGLWRIKTNEELDKLIEHMNIITFVKAQRLNWLGHIERMLEKRVAKKINNWKPIASQPIGGLRIDGMMI
jgi:ATP-dependent helicase/DNAse subunit B